MLSVLAARSWRAALLGARRGRSAHRLNGAVPSVGVGGTLLALVLLGASPAAHADRAVVVGVGEYAISQYNLPGIERDIENAQKILTALGVPRAQQRVITNSEATAAQIKGQITWALAAGPTERAFVYFSGHGTRAADENGTRHSSLVAHDFRPIGNGRADGIILGNWMGAALDKSTARLAFLLVDACESGAITKALWTGSDGQSHPSVVNKYIATPGAAAGSAAEPFYKSITREVEARWVVMTAVQADQMAPASPIGSPFTLAVWSTMTRGDPMRMTPKQLRDAVAQDLRSELGVPVDTTPHGVNPQVWASNPSLLDAPLRPRQAETPETPPESGSPPPPQREPAPPPQRESAPAPARPPVATASRSHWSRIEQLVAHSQPGTLKLSNVKAQYKVGEELSLTLNLKRGGYLTLINVDRDDEAAVIVPNKVLGQAKLDAGTHTIPADLFPLASKPFPIRAASPGEILLVALLTPKPIELAAGAKGTFPRLDERLLQLIEAQKPGCHGCRLFMADVGDADSSAPFVTRPEAVSVQTAIVE
jgi:hypothetical protein